MRTFSRWGARKGVEMPLSTLIVIVILLIVLAFVFFPMIKRSWFGVKLMDQCQAPAECLVSCPSDYMHQRQYDSYCQQYFGTESAFGGGGKCCEPLNPGTNDIVLKKDITVYFNTKDQPIPNLGTVTLGSASRLFSTGSNVVSGKFIVEIGPSASEKSCFWEFGYSDADGLAETIGFGKSEQSGYAFGRPTGKEEFEELQNDLYRHLREQYPSTDLDAGKTPYFAKSLDSFHFKGGSKFPCKDFRTGGSEMVLDINEYMLLMGKTMQFTIIVMDMEQCMKENEMTLDDFDPEVCSSYRYTIHVKVPERNPRITLNVDGKSTSTAKTPTPIASGHHTLQLVVDEPLQSCTIETSLSLAKIPTTNPSLSSELAAYFEHYPSGTTGSKVFDEQNCFRTTSYKRSVSLSIPEDAPGGIPFELNVMTSFPQIGGRSVKPPVTGVYRFVTAPDPRFTVKGPAPGLEKEKQIEIACKGISCTTFRALFVADPFQCQNGKSHFEDFGEIANLTVYSGQGSGRWRFPIRSEQYNGQYLCIQASTSIGDRYALGLWNNVVTPKTIDATPPIVDIQYNPWVGLISMSCIDPGSRGIQDPTIQADSISGCKQHPFSYAYVTDPLLFITQITTAGMVSDTFSGCPDPDQSSAWTPWNSDRAEMPYVGSQDIRILCVRATDNAGNSVVKTKLLYGGPEVLAMFLKTYLG